MLLITFAFKKTLNNNSLFILTGSGAVVAHQSHNLGVVGSSPILPDYFKNYLTIVNPYFSFLDNR